MEAASLQRHPEWPGSLRCQSTANSSTAAGSRPSMASHPGMGRSGPAHRSTTITSYCLAVGGRPVSNLAFTTARRLPKRAAVEQLAGDDLLHHSGREVPAQPDPGDLVGVLHRPQPPALEHDAVDGGHADPGDGRASPGPRIDPVELAGGRMGHDQGLAVGGGLDAVEVELPAGVGRRAADRQPPERLPRDPGSADRHEVQLGLARIGEPGAAAGDGHVIDDRGGWGGGGRWGDAAANW
jgi:hypothetical protein